MAGESIMTAAAASTYSPRQPSSSSSSPIDITSTPTTLPLMDNPSSGLRRRRLRHLKSLGLTIKLPANRSSRQSQHHHRSTLFSSIPYVLNGESTTTSSSSSSASVIPAPPSTTSGREEMMPLSPEACMTRILYSNPHPPSSSRSSSSSYSSSSPTSIINHTNTITNSTTIPTTEEENIHLPTSFPPPPPSDPPAPSTTTSLQDLLLSMRERKRRRLRRSQAVDLTRLTVHGPEVLLPPAVLEDYPEHCCSICLDVLTHPISLKACNHLFCRLCIFEMIQTCLQTGQYAPCCPLCRTEIERMSDIIKEKALAERIYALFPEQVMAKVSTTHSLDRQKSLAGNIKALAEMIFEAVEGEMMMSSEGGVGSEEEEGGDAGGGGRGGGSVSAYLMERSQRSTSSGGRGRRGVRHGRRAGENMLQEGGLWMSTGRGGDDEDHDFLLLTVELICLAYSVLLFLFLVWLRMSQFYM